MKYINRGICHKFVLTLVLIILIIGGVGLNVHGEMNETWNADNRSSITKLDLHIQECSVDSNDLPQPLTAPPGPVRQPAEFEPMEGVLIRYPFGISYSLIAEMSEDVNVVTIVNNDTEKNTVESNYISNGVNMANCKWLIAGSNTYWTRDYGPWFVFNGLDQQGIVNHTYNRPSRTKDNVIPEKYGINQSIPVYDMPLVHSGGNYMCDGMGIAISTDLVLDENPSLTQPQIEQTVLSYLGIHTYHLVPDALGEYIKHIDCWAKFLAPDKILIGQVPQTHPRYTNFEAAVQYFENQTSSFGRPYKIYRVYAPNGEPYTNSLILNDKVLVPITGSANDNAAIATYQSALPSHEILGFTGSWAKTDALHCRTMGIKDRDMLYIEHIPLEDAEPDKNGFYLEAKVIPNSGGTLIGMPKLYWRFQGTGAWQEVSMTSIGNDIYSSYISSNPQPVDGSIIEYYIEAQDTFGESGKHPFVEPFHTFTVKVVPPVITEVQTEPVSQIPDETVEISANVTDNIEVDKVYLQITYPDDTVENFSITQNVTGNYYKCNRTYSEIGIYQYTIWASDINNKWAHSDRCQFEILDVINPIADAGPDQFIMKGTEVVFNGTGSSDNVGIVNWTWEASLNTSGTLYLFGPTPRYTFNQVGNFHFFLTINDSADLHDSDWVWINVSSPDYIVINSKYTEPKIVSVNTEIHISCQVKNIGGFDADAESVMGFYNSTTPDDPFYEFIVEPLGLDQESDQIDVYWVAPDTADTYFVAMETDYFNEIDELDEDNNNLTLEFIVVGKPVTTPNIGPPNYVEDGIYITSSTNIFFSVIDYSGAGISTIKYKVGFGSDWTDIAPGEYFNISEEGLHTIFYYSIDHAGGFEEIKQFEVVIDNTAPQTTVGLGEPSYKADTNDNWFISVNTPINFSTIDSGTLPVGEQYIEYRIDSLPDWNYFTSNFTLNGLTGGPHLIEYRAVDKLKNSEQIQKITLYLDSTAPTTIVNVGTPIYESDKIFITSDTEIKFEVDDTGTYGPGSGVNICYYKIDDSATFNIYNLNEAISDLSEGKQTIHYYSVDWIGNIEPQKEIIVCIDNSAPETTIIPGDEFTLTIMDYPKGNKTNSGIKHTFYRIDDGEWLDYAVTGKFTVPKGKHVISFYSIDNLNNTEEIKTLEFEIKDDEEDEAGIVVMVFGLIIIMVVIFLMILILLKRKRKQDQTSIPGQQMLQPEPEVSDQILPSEQVPSPETDQLEEIPPPPNFEPQSPVTETLPQDPGEVQPPQVSPEPESDITKSEDDFEPQY
jgi:agmatine/peptidylarginine deiminase